MRRRDRPVPFPWPSSAYRAEFKRLRDLGHDPAWARYLIRRANRQARMFPVKGEKCEAYARSTGKPCLAPAGLNGRCKLHGGLSTGPRTPEGKAKALSAIGQKPFSWGPRPPIVQAAIERRRKEIAERIALRARVCVMENE
jgi:hypothetical protein